jgi:hypothetical protein
MSTPTLQRPPLVGAHTILCPDPQCASPAHIDDRWTCESTDGVVEVVKVRCSAGCWYTALAEDVSPTTDR